MQLLELFHEITLRPQSAKELKALILQLAVQGKLTVNWRAANQGVKPATELLKRIEAEKAQLIKEKKIKKEDPLPPIKEDEKPFELPEGWEWCRWQDLLGKVKYPMKRGPFGSALRKDFFVDHGVRIFEQYNPINDDPDWCRYRVTQEKHEELKPFEAGPGDLLISCSGTLGKICELPDGTEIGIINQALLKIRLAEQVISNEYFIRLFRSDFIQSRIYTAAMGSAITNMVGVRELKQFIIPLPPVQEQKAIVTIVESLFQEIEQLEQLTKTRIDQGEDFVTAALRELTVGDTPQAWSALQSHFQRFFKTEQSIKKLRESILQLAVQGKLTANWRAANPNVEPASELLKRIQAEKAQLVKEKKIKKEDPLPPIKEDEKPFELPEGWDWCRVSALVTIKGGKRIPKGYTMADRETPYVYIRVTDMKNGTVLMSNLQFIEKEVFDQISSYTISKNDLYITIAGTIGDVGEIPDELDGMSLTENAAKLIVYQIDKKYLKNLLSSQLCQNQFLDKVNQMAQPKLALHRIGSTLIPLPPVQEQNAIVEKVSQLMAFCDELEEQIKQNQTYAEQLMQSVVREVVG